MNLNYQIQCDDNSINGMFGIICEYSDGKIKNNHINSGAAGLNVISNSSIEIENLTCESLNTIINTAFNSLVSINTNTLTYNNTADLFKNSKNSFVNFPNPKFLSYEQSTGGSLIPTANEYKINNNCKWSSIFGNDGGILSGYIWTDIKEFLQDSIIENNFIYDNNNIIWADNALFPYLNYLNSLSIKLPNSNGFDITFNFLENNKYSNIIEFDEKLSFTLTNFNESNINFINKNSNKIKFNGKNSPLEITLANLNNFTFDNFIFDNCNLNLTNCNIVFTNCNFLENVSINCDNSKISISPSNNVNEILSIFNSNKCNYNNSIIYIETVSSNIISSGFINLENHLIKIGWKNFKENFGDHFTGPLINHTHKFLSFQQGNTQLIINELITGNIPTIDPDNPNAIKEHIYKDTINRTVEFRCY